MKNWKPIYWLYLAIIIVIIIIALYFIFRKPATPPPANNPPVKPKPTTNILGQLLNNAGSWIGGLFNGGNAANPNDCEPGYTGYTNAGNWNQNCLQSNCTPGTPSASDQCIDTCGFPISSDQNPACF